MNFPKLLNTEEVAEILGLNPGTLAAWRCHGSQELPFIKIGRHVKYRESDVFDYIENQTRRTSTLER